MSTTYGIAELAREFGVTPRTIRFYEAEGMLSPARDGQRRVYRPRDRTRLKLILRGRRLGFPLAEVAEIIGLYDALVGEAGQLEFLVEKIATRRAELEAKRDDIDATLSDLDSVARDCRKRLRQLEKGSAGNSRKAKSR